MSLIGEGAYAKIYLVRHVKKDNKTGEVIM